MANVSWLTCAHRLTEAPTVHRLMFLPSRYNCRFYTVSHVYYPTTPRFSIYKIQNAFIPQPFFVLTKKEKEKNLPSSAQNNEARKRPSLYALLLSLSNNTSAGGCLLCTVCLLNVLYRNDDRQYRKDNAVRCSPVQAWMQAGMQLRPTTACLP